MRLRGLVTAAVCAASLTGVVGVSPAAASDGRVNACGKVQDHVWCSGPGETLVGTCPNGFLLVGNLTFDGVDANGDGYVCSNKHRGAVDDTMTSVAL